MNNDNSLKSVEELISEYPFLEPAFCSFIKALDFASDKEKEIIAAFTFSINCFIEHFSKVTDESDSSIIRDHISFLLEKVESIQNPDTDKVLKSYSSEHIIGEGELPPTYEDSTNLSQSSEIILDNTEKQQCKTLQKTISGLSSSFRESPVSKVFKKLQVNHFDNVCTMIKDGLRKSVLQFAHCNQLGNSIIGDTVKTNHIYRFTNSDKTIDKQLGKLYKSEFDFVFTDYSPFLFRAIRRRYFHKCSDYILSICGEEDGPHNLESMIAEGKSSASFLITKNKQYIIKSVTPKEFTFFQTILNDYKEYVLLEPNTLLSRFFGLFGVDKLNISYKFVVMENIIPPIKGITRFDLKGSTFGRSATEEEKESGGILKDLDFSSFYFDDAASSVFCEQLKKDALFLENHFIMDYSLLVGVRVTQDVPINRTESSNEISYYNFPFGSFRGKYDNGNYYSVEYYLGIIDILQPYNIRKKVENALKRVKESQQEISCVDPITYSNRFLNFLQSRVTVNSPEEFEMEDIEL